MNHDYIVINKSIYQLKTIKCKKTFEILRSQRTFGMDLYRQISGQYLKQCSN